MQRHSPLAITAHYKLKSTPVFNVHQMKEMYLLLLGKAFDAGICCFFFISNFVFFVLDFFAFDSSSRRMNKSRQIQQRNCINYVTALSAVRRGLLMYAILKAHQGFTEEISNVALYQFRCQDIGPLKVTTLCIQYLHSCHGYIKESYVLLVKDVTMLKAIDNLINRTTGYA